MKEIERIKQHIRAELKIFEELETKGYTIQGCGNDTRKCKFSNDKNKIVGYVDNKTLEVVFYE
jgi:hypothetical protein